MSYNDFQKSWSCFWRKGETSLWAYAQRVDILFQQDSMHYFETAIKKQKKLVTDLSIQSKNSWWLFCLFQEHKLCQAQETHHETIILTINTTDCGIGRSSPYTRKQAFNWRNYYIRLLPLDLNQKVLLFQMLHGPAHLALSEKKKTTTTTWSIVSRGDSTNSAWSK